MSNATAISVMRHALQQYHYTESPPGSNRTKFGRDYGADGQPWCSYFVWDSGDHGDGDNPIAKANNAGDIQDWTVSKKGGSWVMPKTKSNKTKAEGMKKAKFGDIASFDFGANDMWRDHTALYVGSGYLIEGNTSFDDKGSQDNGGAVALKHRPSNYICSYARPKYKQQDFYKPTTPYTGKLPTLPERGYFKWGDKSDQVKNLQDALKWANGYNLSSDRELGSFTFAEIVIFQVANDLVPDGEFGKKSLDKMKQLIKANEKKASAPAESKPEETKPEETNTAIKNDVKFAQKLYIPTQGDKCYDLSAHQGDLSVSYFEGLKKKGVTCVILRSSWSRMANGKMYQDKCFANNIKNAIKAGMHIGIYHFSASINTSESAEEAKFCLKQIEPYKEHIDLPVGYDCEFGSATSYGKPRFTAVVAKKLGKAGMGKMVDGFCNVIKEAGFVPMIYANLSMFSNYLPANINQTYKIWIAQYNKTCDYKHPYFMWQFTSNNSKLDENVFGTQDTKKKQVEKPTVLPTLPARGWFQKGDKGDGVKLMQKILIYLGFNCGKSGADGDFGGDTYTAVGEYQKKYDMAQDHGWGKQCNQKASELLGLPVPEISKAQKICDEARACAWPEGTKKSVCGYPDGKPKQRYADDLNRAHPDRSKWGKQTKAGASCDVFASVVARIAVDGKFPRGLDEVPAYMKTERGKKLWKTVDKAEPGDIIYQEYKSGGGHEVVNLGDGLVANAHYVGKTFPVIEKYSDRVKPASKCKKSVIYRAR